MSDSCNDTFPCNGSPYKTIATRVLARSNILTVYKDSVFVAQGSSLNFIEGDNIFMDIALDNASGEIDITINSSGGGGGGGSSTVVTTLSATDVKTLNTVPKILLPTLSNNKFYSTINIVIVNNVGTQHFNFAPTTFSIEYTNGQTLFTFDDTFANLGSVGYINIPTATGFNASDVPFGLGVQLVATNAASLGNGTWTAYVSFTTFQSP